MTDPTRAEIMADETAKAKERAAKQHAIDVTNGAIYSFREWYIPKHSMAALRRYVEEGIMPSHFLAAVLENNLSEAIARADNESLANLPAYTAYLYWEVTSPCHGSPEKVQEWIATASERNL